MTTKPYRVVVWGPGGLGTVAIWETLQSKDYELVGVRAYSSEKHGVDSGKLIGVEPTGIKVTTSSEEALAIDCDCVIFTARDHGNYGTDEELLRLLRSGKNVVTALPYQHARLIRDKEFLAQLEEACALGGSVFHATGVDPDLISDRVLLALVGGCNDVRYLSLQENWDMSYTAEETLAICGFGKPPEEAKRIPIAAGIADNFLKQVCLGMAEALDVKYARVESEHEYVPADKDLHGEKMTVRAGTVGRVTHRWLGFTSKNAKVPFFTIEVNWAFTDDMLPAGVRPEQTWVAVIEGRPSFRMVIDMRSSIESGSRFFHIGDTRSDPGYHAVIATCLQAIPSIIESKPGVLPIGKVIRHWRDTGVRERNSN